MALQDAGIAAECFEWGSDVGLSRRSFQPVPPHPAHRWDGVTDELLIEVRVKPLLVGRLLELSQDRAVLSPASRPAASTFVLHRS
jgi:hypothetical protein